MDCFNTSHTFPVATGAPLLTEEEEAEAPLTGAEALKPAPEDPGRGFMGLEEAREAQGLPDATEAPSPRPEKDSKEAPLDGAAEAPLTGGEVLKPLPVDPGMGCYRPEIKCIRQVSKIYKNVVDLTFMGLDCFNISQTFPVTGVLEEKENTVSSEAGAAAAGVYPPTEVAALNPGPELPGKGFIGLEAERLAHTLPEDTEEPLVAGAAGALP